MVVGGPYPHVAGWLRLPVKALREPSSIAPRGLPRHARGGALPRRGSRVARREPAGRAPRPPRRRGALRRAGDARLEPRALRRRATSGSPGPRSTAARGLSPRYQAIFLEEEARAEAPPHIGVIGLGMAGPTIIAHGTEAQKARYLQPLLAADEIWCQGFSEPGAGSDLAGVRTSCAARRRPLRARRAEGLVVVRAHRRLLHPPHPLRPRVRAPRRAHVPDRRHARARGRGAAAPADHRRGRVQRDLLERASRCRSRTCSARSAAAGRSR